ncbi:MAG: ergothioneine biosynthesis glutamate--cysteine ligase EgtA [Frankia sp.]|nr:ergothioneine biosynthesis glutamate--cysteine ligase EgtA [Frankia sp.]
MVRPTVPRPLTADGAATQPIRRGGLTVDEVLAYAADCLPARAGPRRVGVETEWLVVDLADCSRPVAPARASAALAPLLGAGAGSAGGGDAVLPAGGSRVTFEPGGQLELSGPPAPLPAAVAAVRADLADVRAALAEAGLGIAGLGLDPLRRPVQQLTTGRYVAMADYWAASGHRAGAVMMCSSASVQVNLDAGTDPLDVARRFRLAHVLRPVLVGMFAASPARLGRLLAMRSGRTRMWENLDPTRIRPVDASASPPAELPARFADFLLTARLMMVRDHDDAQGDGRLVAVRDGSTFGDWLRGAGPLRRPPTHDDLVRHASTLFPPVRPRGWLEIRYLDAQPDDLWPVAVAVTTALLDDQVAADGARAACAGADQRAWLAACPHGLGDDGLRRAALTCLDLALDGLARLGADDSLLAMVAAFRDRYPARGRTPADALAERIGPLGPAGGRPAPAPPAPAPRPPRGGRAPPRAARPACCAPRRRRPARGGTREPAPPAHRPPR